MKIDLKRNWSTLNDPNAQDFDTEYQNFKTWWNSHDDGSRPWTQIIGGSLGTTASTKSANYSIAPFDQIILVDSTSAVVTITLPSATIGLGRRFSVKDWKGQAATHNITLATTSAQTIDGVTTLVMSIPYQSYTVVSDGANWSVI